MCGAAEGAAQGAGDAAPSRLLQLHVSDVEAAHVLVGALEAPRDVLVHGAVVEVQALGTWSRGVSAPCAGVGHPGRSLRQTAKDQPLQLTS